MIGFHDAEGAYHEELFVEFRDTDRDQHIRLSTWLAWMAGMAGDDYEARGLGRDEMIRRGQVFLVNRFTLKVHRMPQKYETIRAATWEHGVDTIFFNRYHRFETAEGECLAEGRGTWLLCDPVQHRILRPKALDHEVRFIDHEVDCPPVGQIAEPERMDLLGQRKIVYTDLDANHHVYCANYGNIIMDHLPEHLADQPLSTFEITYAREALLGETLDILGTPTPQGYVMVGRHPDGNNSFICRYNV